MYSYGPPHIARRKQDDQLEHTYSSCVRIRDVALKTCQRRWMIGRSGERGSGISVLAARDDDDEEDMYAAIQQKEVKKKRTMNDLINKGRNDRKIKDRKELLKLNDHLTLCLMDLLAIMTSGLKIFNGDWSLLKSFSILFIYCYHFLLSCPLLTWIGILSRPSDADASSDTVDIPNTCIMVIPPF